MIEITEEELAEQWSQRAAVLEYECADMTREQAERAAWVTLWERYSRRRYRRRTWDYEIDCVRWQRWEHETFGGS